MPEQIALFSIMLVGFLGGGHCVGMCGGLSSALIWQLPPHLKRTRCILLLNVSRWLGYVVIGMLLGAAGSAGVVWDGTHTVQWVLFILSNILLAAVGIYLGGWHAAVSRIEGLGKPLWRRVSPYFRNLLPLKSYRACLAAGFLWGWMPCGLVYTASLYALSSGSTVGGGAVMAAFGLGTMPNLLGMAFFSERLRPYLQKTAIRRLAGGLIILWALWQLHLAVLHPPFL